MAKYDAYSKTSIPTEDSLNPTSSALPKEQADALAYAAEQDPSFSADTSFLASMNPDLTAEQRYVINQQASQNYQSIKEKNMTALEHAVRVPSKFAFAAMDYIPDVLNNAIGHGIAYNNGDFENPEDVTTAIGNIFGGGTTLGQLLGQTVNAAGSGWKDELNTGSDFFVSDTSAVQEEKFKAQAQLYGWDTVDQYGDRTNIGSVVASQLMHFPKGSVEANVYSTITDMGAIGLQFIGISEIANAIKGGAKAVKGMRAGGAMAEGMETGKRASSAFNAIDELDNVRKQEIERFAAVDSIRNENGNDIADVLADTFDDGQDAISDFLAQSKKTSDLHKTEGKTTAEIAAAEVLYDEVKGLNKTSANIDVLDANLEMAHIAAEAKIAQVSSKSYENMAKVDAEISSLTARNTELNAIPNKTPEHIAELESNNIRLANAQAEKQIFEEARIPVKSKNYDAPVKTVAEIDNEINATKKSLTASKSKVTKLKNKGASAEDIAKAEQEVTKHTDNLETLKTKRSTAPETNVDSKGHKIVDTEDTVVNPIAADAYQAINDIKTVQNAAKTLKQTIDEKAVEIANRAAAKMGVTPDSPIKNYNDAKAFLEEYSGKRVDSNGNTKINGNKLLKFITGGGIDDIAEGIIKINKASEAEGAGRLHAILRKYNIPVEYISRLAKAETTDEVKAIFLAALSKGDIGTDIGKMRLIKWQSRILDSEGNVRTIESYDNIIEKMYNGTKDTIIRGLLWSNDKMNIDAPFARSYDTFNANEMTNGIVDMIEFTAGKFGIPFVGKNGREWRAFKNRSSTKMINAKTAEERRQVWYSVQKEMIALAGKAEGISDAQRKVLINAFNKVKGEHEAEIARLAKAEADEPLSELTKDMTAADKELSKAIIYEMHLGTRVTMINPYDMRRMIKTGKSIEQIKKAESEAKGFKKAYYNGKDILVSFIETFYDRIFKRAVLFRLGYVVRNTLETQIRMFLAGHPSSMTNPGVILSLIGKGKAAEKIINSLDETTKAKAREFIGKLNAGTDIKGNIFGEVSKETTRVLEINVETNKLTVRISKLNDKIKTMTNEEDIRNARLEIDSLESQRKALYAERNNIDVSPELEQDMADFFNKNSVRENITNPTIAPNASHSSAKDDYVMIDLFHEDFLTGVAEYVLKIASDPIAKDVLAARTGRVLSKEVRSHVKEYKLENLSPEEQVLDYYWHGAGREYIDSLRQAQGGKNAELFSTKEAVYEHLFGEGELTYNTLVRNFTDNFNESLVDIITEAKFTKIDANGNVIEKRYPRYAGDYEATTKLNSDEQLADTIEAFKDTVQKWIDNPAEAKIIKLPKANWNVMLEQNNKFIEAIITSSDKIYDWSSKAESIFATIPEFKYAHWDYVSNIIHTLTPEDAAKVVKVAERLLGKNVPGAWANTTLRNLKKNAKYAAGDGTFTIDDVQIAANNHASREVTKMFYDASKRNAYAHSLRFIMPFAQAWGNSLKTWTKLALKNPEQVYKAELFYKSLESEGSGWIYAATGQDQYDVNKPFIFEDPTTGKKVFGIPFIGAASAGLANLFMVIQGKEAAFKQSDFASTGDVASGNLLFQSSVPLPGFGPVIQTPFALLQSNETLNRIIPQELKTIISPGSISENVKINPVETLTPAWINELFNPESRNKYITGAMNALLLKNPDKYYNDSGDISADGQRLLINDAQIVANGLAVGRGLWQFFSPVSSKTQAAFEDKNGQYHLQATITAEHHDLLKQGYDQNEAMTKMIDTYGFNAYVCMVSTTNSGFTPSNDAWDAIKNNPELGEESGSILSLFYPGGGFNAEYNQYLKTGNNKLTPEEYTQKINQTKFTAMESELDRKLMTGELDELGYEKSIANLNKRKGEIEGSISMNWREANIASMQNALTKYPELTNTSAGKTIYEYLQYRNAALKYGNLDNKGQYDNRVKLYDIGTQLAAENPEFSVAWYRILKSEVKPNQEDIVNPNEQAK